MVVETSYRSWNPAKSCRWTLADRLQEAARQVLPEPRIPHEHRPPSEYGSLQNGQVHWADGMYEDYKPTLFTKVYAAITLGLYIGIPQIILALAILSWWHPWMRAFLAVVISSAFLPLRPLFSKRVMHSHTFLAWRRYFRFSYVFEQSLSATGDFVIAQFPHGAFPLGTLMGGTFMATEYPEYSCYALAANN